MHVVPQLAGLFWIAALPMQVRITDRAVFILVAVAKVSGVLCVLRRRETGGQIFLNLRNEGHFGALRRRGQRRFWGRRGGVAGHRHQRKNRERTSYANEQDHSLTFCWHVFGELAPKASWL